MSDSRAGEQWEVEICDWCESITGVREISCDCTGKRRIEVVPASALSSLRTELEEATQGFIALGYVAETGRASARFTSVDGLEHVRKQDNAYLLERAEAAEAELERLREALEQAAFESHHEQQPGHLERDCIVCVVLAQQEGGGQDA